MVDLHREEDKKALIGTVTFYALILLLIILLAMFSCGKTEDELEPSGGIAVSYGNPDNGGPDNSAAEQEEAYTPPIEEEYTPENQLTSDVDEAPVIKKTEPSAKPKPKVTKPTVKPTEKQKPTEKPKEVKTPNAKDLFGKDKSGAGKNGSSNDRGGYQGRPDGEPKGGPEGTGGTGTAGRGTGDGPAIGPGISGGIGGFSIAAVTQPKGGVQEKGVVRLKVCVDELGNVIPNSIKYSPDRDPETTTNLTLRQNAITALKKFRFSNNSGSSGGCGYINFTFKLN
jgi:hypothetical protein